MNPWESSLDLHDNYNNPDFMMLYPGLEEIRHQNENFLRSVLVPPASGSLESLVAQATFLCTTKNHEQPPASVPLEGVYTNMPNNMPFIDDKSSVPSVPATSHWNNNLASTASSSRDVTPNINDTCYQGKIAQLKVRTSLRNKQRREFSLQKKRRQSINRSLSALLTMSGTSTYKTDTASMLEGVTNHMELLRLQSKMANLMNIAPKDVTLAIQRHLKSMDPNLKSGDAVGAMKSNMKSENAAGIGPVDADIVSSSPVIAMGENVAGIGPIGANTISSTPAIATTKMSVVHPTTYVPSRQTMDPVVARAPTVDPIFAYVVAAGKTKLPSMGEVAELTATFEQLQKKLDSN